MKLIKKGEGEHVEVKRHFDQWGIHKAGAKDGAQRLSAGISYFLPQGGAEMYASPTERIYYGISGSLMIRGKQGDEYLVEPGDVLYIPPGEERSIEAMGTEPSSVLVIIVNLD